MKSLTAALLAIMLLRAVVVVAVNTQFQTRVISTARLTIHVRDGVYLTIRNFTQDQPGTAGERGVIMAGIFPTPAPTATPSPTPTPTPTPTPCASCTPTPTPTPTPPPTPTPTPIMAGGVLAAAITSAPKGEFVKEIVVAGPAVLTIDPVLGATLSITYRKTQQPSGTPTPTPTSTSTATPTATPTPTIAALSVGSSTTSSQSVTTIESTVSDDDDTFSSTPTPTPTPTPGVSRRVQTVPSTPTATPSPTPLATPTS